jgi:hypothetical protein
MLRHIYDLQSNDQKRDSEMDALYHINCRNPNLEQMDTYSNPINRIVGQNTIFSAENHRTRTPRHEPRYCHRDPPVRPSPTPSPPKDYKASKREVARINDINIARREKKFAKMRLVPPPKLSLYSHVYKEMLLPFKHVTFDEAHYGRDPKSDTHQAIKALYRAFQNNNMRIKQTYGSTL